MIDIVPHGPPRESTGGLYLTWVTSPPGHSPEAEELARVNASSGKVTARRRVEGAVAEAVIHGGSLFVLVTSNGEDLLRLNPVTLTEIGHWHLGRAQVPGSEASAMVVAGPGMWIATGPELERSYTGKVLRSIPKPGAVNADLATTRLGSVLLVGEASASGEGEIERLGIVTGELMEESPPLSGIVNPFLTSVTGNDFWVEESTGMMGYVQLYHLTPLGPVGSTCGPATHTQTTATCILGTNGTRARMADGDVFITKSPGTNHYRAYCATPGGQVLAALPVPSADAILAIGPKVLFVRALSPGNTAVKEVPIPPACHAS